MERDERGVGRLFVCYLDIQIKKNPGTPNTVLEEPLNEDAGPVFGDERELQQPGSSEEQCCKTNENPVVFVGGNGLPRSSLLVLFCSSYPPPKKADFIYLFPLFKISSASASFTLFKLRLTQ